MLSAVPPSTPSSCPQLRSAWASPAGKTAAVSPAGETAAASPFKHPLSRPILHLVDHSSDKSSQDRLSFLDHCLGPDEQEGAAASAGASSRLNSVPAALADSTPDCSLEYALGTSSSIQTTTRLAASCVAHWLRCTVKQNSCLETGPGIKQGSVQVFGKGSL